MISYIADLQTFFSNSLSVFSHILQFICGNGRELYFICFCFCIFAMLISFFKSIIN